MSLMYSWATPEYMLWRMSLGQLVMWHNAGIEVKYPNEKKPGEENSIKHMTREQRKEAIRAAREAMKAERRAEAEAEREAENEAAKAEYRAKYGDV